MNNKIPLFYPYIPKEKILSEISDSLDGRWLGQGPKVNKFEKRFGEMFGYEYPLMLCIYATTFIIYLVVRDWIYQR